MRLSFGLGLAFAGAASLCPHVAFASPSHSGKVIVKFKEAGAGRLSAQGFSGVSFIQSKLRAALGISPLSLEVEKLEGLVANLHTVNLGQGSQFYRALEALKADPSVEYAEPDYQVSINFGSKQPAPAPAPAPQPTSTPTPTLGTPNDPSFSKEWALYGSSAYGVNVKPLWLTGATGSKKVVVAIVDTGVDYTHPDLKANLDTADGYNFVANSSNADDDNGHGSHVAGIIGAVGNNAQGVVGVNWNVSIIPIKFLDSSGSGSTSDGIKGINWAVSHGARVINCSWGGPDGSQALKDAIDAARRSGVLVIVAAGNESANNDTTASYPANFHLDNMITVAATDVNGKLASFSNYGKKLVDIAAPGVDIYSSYKDGQYKSLSGTSMATPMVAGVAALVLSKDPSATYQSVKDAIFRCGTPLSSASGTTATGRLVNAFNAYTGVNCD